MILGTVISSITGIFQIARSEDIALDVRKGTFELGEFGEGEGSHPHPEPCNLSSGKSVTPTLYVLDMRLYFDMGPIHSRRKPE